MRKRPNLDDALGILKGRRRELEESVEAAERGTALEARIAELRNDMARHKAKRARFAAHGDRPLEWVTSTFDQRFGITVEWVVHSKLTGAGYAQAEAATIAQFQAEIDRAEAELADLVGAATG